MKIISELFNLKKYRFMTTQLVKRDFKVRYRGSILGILWSVLNPFLNMFVLSIVFSQVFKTVDNYKLYLLAGLVLFNFFSEATNLSVGAFVSNFGLITKVYFPRIILPLSKVLSSTVNLFMSLIAFFILGIFSGINVWWGYIFILYILICLLLFTSGISFILSTLQVFMRDIQHLYSVIILIWMYATPIMYPINIIPDKFLSIFKLNPLYNFINFFRDITLYNKIPDGSSFLVCGIWGVVAFCLGIVLISKKESEFIYYT